MAIRKFKPEQIVTVVQKIEVQIKREDPPQACKEAGIHTQTYYRWRKELEKENPRLKRLVAELSLGKQGLRDGAQGNF